MTVHSSRQKTTRLILLRVFLLLLILANMGMIYAFSSENGKQSDNTSGKVSRVIAETAVPKFEEKPPTEQARIVKSINTPLRKIAHMTEFGSLGALVLLFLMTFSRNAPLMALPSLGFTFLYAGFDELHQKSVEGRGPQMTDVLIDTSGAVITILIILLIWFFVTDKSRKARSKVVVTRYTLQKSPHNPFEKIAVVADLHGEPGERILDLLRAEAPDLILIPGDLMEDRALAKGEGDGYNFLRAAAAIAPTFYTLGNHEIACYHKGNPWKHPIPVFPSDETREKIRSTGAFLLENDAQNVRGAAICGLTSGIDRKKNEPDAEALRRFDGLPFYRILLCHHPEYYRTAIKQTGIDLIVCGHAHGGQWRFFGKGVYAPGQGLFPKDTAGVLDGRCVISRGLGNHTRIPRFFNPRELVILTFSNQKAENGEH